MKQYLPIGSVVLLHGMDHRVMIFGRKQHSKSSDKEYDYVGCLFPEGIQNSDHVQLFNESDIQIVFSIGYQDIEEFRLRDIISKEKGA